MKISLAYKVDVIVEVDLDGARVTKVWVDDESVSDTVHDAVVMNDPEEFLLALDDQRILDAHRIVQDADEWPAWEFGS